MKFHCDRCNTRYSIADERVRGKILKVRCKSCSAVITVRESASEAPDGASPGIDEGGNTPAPRPADRPAVRPPSQSQRGPQTGPQPVRPTGPQPVPQIRPQTGPQTVRPTGPQPVPQTRPQTGPQPVRPTGPQPVPQTRPQTGPQTVRPTGPQTVPQIRPQTGPQTVRPTGPQTVPQVTPGRTSAVRAAVGPRQETVRPPPPGASRSELVWYVSCDGEQTGPLSLAGAREWIVSSGGGAPLYCWREGFADWQAVLAVPEFRDLETPRAQSQPPRAARPLPQPRPPTAPPPAPAPVSPPVSGSSGASQSAPVVLAASSSSVAKLSDDAFGAAAEDDLDLAIEEPSRIVKLDMLEAYRNASAAQGRGTGNLAAIPGRDEPGGTEQGSQALRLGQGTGSVTALGAMAGMGRPVSDIGQNNDEVRATDKRRRSSMPLIIGGVGVLCVGATALAVMILRAPGTSEESALSGNVPGSFENLGYQVDRPDRKTAGNSDPGGAASDKGDITEDGSPGTTEKTSRRRPGSSATASSSGAASGAGKKVEPSGDERVSYSGDGAGALTPLSPDDIIRQSSRSQFGFERCYERAKKKDPFFEIKSVTIDLEVSPAGNVSRVTLSKYEDTVFGTCMTARVQQWTFRASTSGIRTKLPVVFEQ